MSVLYSRIRCNSIIFNINLSRHMSISWICTAQVDCWREIYFFTQNLANCEQISRQQYTWNLMIQLYLAENRSSTKTHASSQEPAMLLSFIVCIIKITIKRPYRVTKPTYRKKKMTTNLLAVWLNVFRWTCLGHSEALRKFYQRTLPLKEQL